VRRFDRVFGVGLESASLSKPALPIAADAMKINRLPSRSVMGSCRPRQEFYKTIADRRCLSVAGKADPASFHVEAQGEKAKADAACDDDAL